MTLTKAQITALPKAKLVDVKFIKRWPWDYKTRSPFFLAWRNANARGFMFGNVMVTVRAAWLERPARVLHPEAFDEEGGLGQ